MKNRHLAVIALFALAGCSAQPDAPPPATPSTSENPAAGNAQPSSRPPTDAPPAAAPPADNAPSPAPPAPSGVPGRFQGTFALDAQACAQSGHETRLELSSNRIRFHESGGPIEQVQVTGDTLKLVARLTGEGETREATYRFELLQDASQLRDLDHGMVRVRCP